MLPADKSDLMLCGKVLQKIICTQPFTRIRRIWYLFIDNKNAH